MGRCVEIVYVVWVWEGDSLRMHLDGRRCARMQWYLRIHESEISLLVQLWFLL